MSTVLASERRSRRPPLGAALPLALPLAVLLVGAWSRRWMSDDGFINLRIVEQLWAGNGPVWNAEERVETGTSPLWLAVLAAAGGLLRVAPLEWVAVVLGVACTVGGLLLAASAARHLHGGGTRPLVPLGAVVVAALPPFWDFASSGLETGLTFLWLGAGGWALVTALPPPSPSPRRAAATAVLLGLGPLVRPDLALVAGPALLALGAGEARRGWRRAGRVVLAAAVVPVGYQVFRMAYFAALVPNTAFAKEGGRSRWDVGWDYAGDYAGTWRLWWPALVVAAVAVPVVAGWRRAPEGGAALAVAGISAGAALHALYVVRVGGDFMHARLLLPATFALALPWAVVPARRTSLLAAAALLPWAAGAALAWEPPGQPTGEPAEGVVDERAYYVAIAGRANPVTAEDFSATPYARAGREASVAAVAGRGDLSLHTFAPGDRDAWWPRASPDAPFLVAVDNVGVFGYLAGPEVTVVDLRGLGDPVASRFRLEGERGRPGHEKHAGAPWVLGRHADPVGGHRLDPSVDRAATRAAREALSCGQLDEVLRAITAPLTPGRAVANARLAVGSYGLRFSADPRVAEAELCGR